MVAVGKQPQRRLTNGLSMEEEQMLDEMVQMLRILDRDDIFIQISGMQITFSDDGIFTNEESGGIISPHTRFIEVCYFHLLSQTKLRLASRTERYSVPDLKLLYAQFFGITEMKDEYRDLL